MRIGFATPEYVTERYFSGGLANSIHRTSVALSARGHDVHVFTLSDEADEDLVSDGISVHRIARGRLAPRLTRMSGGRLVEAGEWIDLSIRAWRRIARAHRSSRFDVLQFPNYLARSMRGYAERACNRHCRRLIFVDQIRHAQLYPVIAGSRLVVLPSLVDNLPNACLEAMALGKPVIGTCGTSFEELMTDGVTGFLVPPGDRDALAEKVNEVWNRSDLDGVGQAAKERVTQLSPEHTIPLLENYLESVIEGRGRPFD